MTPAEKRAILVRAKAHEFASTVRNCPGLAFSIPDAVIDWLTDEEIPAFFDYCRTFRIIQRADEKWEARP